MRFTTAAALVMPELQVMLPELFLLGSYAADKRTGPALWLRCIEARVVEGSPGAAILLGIDTVSE